jgi:deazaflavin-dependent oxidoreductase (nitroreductase family)
MAELEDPEHDVPVAEPPTEGAWAVATPLLHRGFKALNRWFMLPVHHAGLGPWVSTPFGGWILVLRVRGRKSGRLREAPLNYLIEDGAVWVMAGFGRRTEWYRNLLADPAVEVRLPDRRFACTADEVPDPAVRARIIPRLVRTAGLPGTMVVPSPWTAPDEAILDATTWVPLIRLRTRDGSPIEAGPDDPGGNAWVWRQAVVAAVSLVAWRLARRLLRRRRSAPAG